MNAPRIEPYIAPEDIRYASASYLRQLLKEDLDVELHDMISYELFERRGLKWHIVIHAVTLTK